MSCLSIKRSLLLHFPLNICLNKRCYPLKLGDMLSFQQGWGLKPPS